MKCCSLHPATPARLAQAEAQHFSFTALDLRCAAWFFWHDLINVFIGGMLGGLFGGSSATGGKGAGRQRMSTGEMIVRSAAQSAARSIGTQVTRAILRGVLGGISRK